MVNAWVMGAPRRLPNLSYHKCDIVVQIYWNILQINKYFVRYLINQVLYNAGKLEGGLNVKRLGEGGTQTFDGSILPQPCQKCKGEFSINLGLGTPTGIRTRIAALGEPRSIL